MPFKARLPRLLPETWELIDTKLTNLEKCMRSAPPGKRIESDVSYVERLTQALKETCEAIYAAHLKNEVVDARSWPTESQAESWARQFLQLGFDPALSAGGLAAWLGQSNAEEERPGGDPVFFRLVSSSISDFAKAFRVTTKSHPQTEHTSPTGTLDPTIECLRDAIQELLFFSTYRGDEDAVDAASTALQTIRNADIAPPGYLKETWLHQLKLEAFKLYGHITGGELTKDRLQRLMAAMKERQDELWAIRPPAAGESELMLMAIEEARKSVTEDDRAHPKVGAVVFKNGIVLATAHRGELGKGDHAEYTALEKKLADQMIAGATVYTTLEPCTTRKHPKVPCAERIVERRVQRVVIGMLDPNLNICGRGERYLRKHGIRVDRFPHDLIDQIEELNRDFTRAQEQCASVRPEGPQPLMQDSQKPNPFRLLCDLAMQITKEETERDCEQPRARQLRTLGERAVLESRLRDFVADCVIAGRRLGVGREREAEQVAQELSNACIDLLAWEAAERLGKLSAEEAAQGGPCVALCNRVWRHFFPVDHLARLYDRV